MSEEEVEDNPLQGYFEWQVTTLMLAYDLRNPLDRDDKQGWSERRSHVEQEVSRITLELVPQEFIDNTSKQWPPELLMAITRETLKYACDLANIV